MTAYARLHSTTSPHLARTGTLLTAVVAACLALAGLTSVPAQAADTGRITGTITDAEGVPLAGVSVDFRRGESEGSVGVSTQANGFFDSGQIPTGTIRVRVSHSPSNNQTDVRDYVSEYWSTGTTPARTFAEATPIELKAGDERVNVNVALDIAPRVRLTVKDATGNPVPRAPIGLYTLLNGVWGPNQEGQGGPRLADANGVYRRNVLLGQSNKLYASPLTGAAGVTEWYQGAYSESTATPVTATEYGQLIDITIQLDGAPTQPPAGLSRFTTSKVTVKGTAKVGKKLRASTRAWGPAPVKLSYTWYRNGKTIKGQKKSTYRVRDADKGKRITVRVHQRKPGYATANRLSGKTAKVKKR